MSLNNIPEYSPTQYIDNSEPDINAANLNKTEQALKRVTAAANEAIAALPKWDSTKIDTAKIVNSLAATDTSSVLSGALGPVIDQRLSDLLNKYNQLNGEMGTTLSTGILEKARTLTANRTYFYFLNGASYTAGDLPSSSYAYGCTMVLCRSSTSIRVVLWGGGSVIPVYNEFDGSGWSGWKKFDGSSV